MFLVFVLNRWWLALTLLEDASVKRKMVLTCVKIPAWKGSLKRQPYIWHLNGQPEVRHWSPCFDWSMRWSYQGKAWGSVLQWLCFQPLRGSKPKWHLATCSSLPGYGEEYSQLTFFSRLVSWLYQWLHIFELGR